MTVDFNKLSISESNYEILRKINQMKQIKIQKLYSVTYHFYRKLKQNR